jgi:alpha-mannosidase
MRLQESRVLSSGPLIGELETLGDLIDPQNGEVWGTYRQRTRVVAGRPYVEVQLEVSPAKPLEGDPWTHYIGCRFAWKHEDVALTGSMQQGAHPISRERFETPHYLEIADGEFRTTLLFPGMPFHRKTGERMLDTLLITDGETARQFQFAVAIDAVYPLQAQLDVTTPAVVHVTRTSPPEGSRSGWFLYVTASNVLIQRVLPGALPGTVIVRLLETEGRARTLGLHCCRGPRSARQVNFQGETITTLRIDDAVTVEMGPYELCDVELTFA